MPSYRSQFCRMLIKYLVAKKFNPNKTIDEMLLDDSTRIAEKAKRAEVDVTLKIYDKMWHVWHLNAKLMPEAKNAIKELGSFIRKHFS